MASNSHDHDHGHDDDHGAHHRPAPVEEPKDPTPPLMWVTALIAIIVVVFGFKMMPGETVAPAGGHATEQSAPAQNGDAPADKAAQPHT